MNATQTSCRALDAVLSAYVDHEATQAEMATVERHARTCPACAARLRQYQAQTPRLEADVRALLANGDATVAQAAARRHRFRPPPDRLALQTPRFGRVATVALGVAMVALAALVLARSAPAERTSETAAQPSAPAPDRAPVLVASIDGLVDPAVAAYLRRAVTTAEENHAGALVIVLGASGGLDASMQEVAQDLAHSSVPVLAFIPVGRTNVATASLAQASAAVATTPNLDEFLQAGPLPLVTAGARIENLDMQPLEAIAHRLMDPTTAYLLFVLGLYAAFVELAHPGALLPGATGLVCLALASVSFAMLPTNWLGVAVLIAAVGLMALELKAATHGALVLAGVGCLIVGSLLLYAAPGSALPTQADVSVAPAVLIGAAGTGLVVGLLLARIAQRIHSLPPVLSLDQLIGARGVSRGALDPDGVVHVGGQLWSARLRGGILEPGQPVRVVARHGLVLEVESVALGAATRKGIGS